jgi:hypothetical protein
LSLPPVLHLHLKRFEYNMMSGTLDKVNDRYEFPLHLDLDEFVEPEIKEINEDDNGGVNDSNAAAASVGGAGGVNDTDGDVAMGGQEEMEHAPPLAHGRPRSHSTAQEQMMDPTVKRGNQYTLQAVLVHSGGVGSGHYWVCARIPEAQLEEDKKTSSKAGVSSGESDYQDSDDNKMNEDDEEDEDDNQQNMIGGRKWQWYKFDDTQVTKVSRAEAMNQYFGNSWKSKNSTKNLSPRYGGSSKHADTDVENSPGANDDYGGIDGMGNYEDMGMEDVHDDEDQNGYIRNGQQDGLENEYENGYDNYGDDQLGTRAGDDVVQLDNESHNQYQHQDQDHHHHLDEDTDDGNYPDHGIIGNYVDDNNQMPQQDIELPPHVSNKKRKRLDMGDMTTSDLSNSQKEGESKDETSADDENMDTSVAKDTTGIDGTDGTDGVGGVDGVDGPNKRMKTNADDVANKDDLDSEGNKKGRKKSTYDRDDFFSVANAYMLAYVRNDEIEKVMTIDPLPKSMLQRFQNEKDRDEQEKKDREESKKFVKIRVLQDEHLKLFKTSMMTQFDDLTCLRPRGPDYIDFISHDGDTLPSKIDRMNQSGAWGHVLPKIPIAMTLRELGPVICAATGIPPPKQVSIQSDAGAM